MATTPIKFMDVRFINPFIVSLVSIFKEMAGLTMEKGTLVKGQAKYEKKILYNNTYLLSKR